MGRRLRLTRFSSSSLEGERAVENKEPLNGKGIETSSLAPKVPVLRRCPLPLQESSRTFEWSPHWRATCISVVGGGGEKKRTPSPISRPRPEKEGAPRKTPGFFFLFALLPLHSLQPPSLPLFNTPPFKHPKTAIPQASRRRFQLRRLRWPFTQLQQQPPFLLLLLNQQPQLPTGSGRLEGRRRERARRRRRGESSREGRPRLAREGSRREVPAPRLGPASGLVPGLSASAQGRAGTVYGRERSF